MAKTIVPTFSLYDRLTKAREVAGLTQAELAARLDVGVRTVGRAEKAEHTPKRGELIAWALACGVSPSWLLFGQPEEGDTNLFTGEVSVCKQGYGQLTLLAV